VRVADVSDRARLEAYRPFALAISRSFFFPGADRDDVEQEALIGLWKAVRDFNGEGDFKAFAGMCIRRQLVTGLKTALRGKHESLTRSLRDVVLEEESVVLVENLPDLRADTVEILEHREELAELLRIVAEELSPFERRALIGRATGLTYKQIGEKKSVDNALVRARGKLADPPTWGQVAA